MIKKYKAYATISYDCVCEFEIEDDEDPWEFARSIDGGDFMQIDNSGDWKVYEVTQMHNLECPAVDGFGCRCEELS
jgi:hypothetical protein